MNTFLKAMILPMAASALLNGTAANAQVLSHNPVMSTEKGHADMFDTSNGAPVMLVDDDEGDHEHSKWKRRFLGGDDDHEDGDDEDDVDGQGGTNAGSQNMDGPVPDNGLFNNGTKPTAEVQ